MSEFVYAPDHEEACKERDQFGAAMVKVLGQLNDMTRDRDEWKQQHANLLAMYRAQTAELAKLRALRRGAGT